MKVLTMVATLICLALVLFGAGVFLAWVFAGIYVSDELFSRAFFGASIGGLGLFFCFMAWIEL